VGDSFPGGLTPTGEKILMVHSCQGIYHRQKSAFFLIATNRQGNQTLTGKILFFYGFMIDRVIVLIPVGFTPTRKLFSLSVVYNSFGSSNRQRKGVFPDGFLFVLSVGHRQAI